MTHSSRFNYKAKAKTQASTPTIRENSAAVFTEANFLLKQQNEASDTAHEALTECVRVAQTCISFLDSFRKVGDTEFEECKLVLDEHLHEANMSVMARRVKHILGLMGQRLEESQLQLDALIGLRAAVESHLESTKSVVSAIKTPLVEKFYIGKRPTSAEIRDFTNAREKGEHWSRDTLDYDSESDGDTSEPDEYEASGEQDVAPHKRNALLS